MINALVEATSILFRVNDVTQIFIWSRIIFLFNISQLFCCGRYLKGPLWPKSQGGDQRQIPQSKVFSFSSATDPKTGRVSASLPHKNLVRLRWS